jgi:guanylate kinase|tara:strand:- start:153 stop:764 length:612 start_codon:yes stop_codon:yes gene_type:complete
MLNKGKLIIFAAPSGAGKSSLINKIIERDLNNFELSISATTRAQRDGETHGKDYFFISDNEFNELKNSEAFIEYAVVHGHQYGTLKSFINEKLETGTNIVLDIDVQGFKQIKEVIKDTISIFIIPPSIEELSKRLTMRGLDSDKTIKERLINAKTELKSAELFDYIVLNQDFDKALEEISSIIFSNSYKNNDVNMNILKELLD